MHTTNYSNAFISVTADCPAETGSIPPEMQDPTIARLQYEMISAHPYRYTSDEVIFADHAVRSQMPPAELDAQREAFFSKGQACLRTSLLGKRYGWGIHHDTASRVALYPRESKEYIRLSQDPVLRQVKAMKSAR